MPGFANMIQGELSAAPLETLSVHGICAAGVGAIQAAAQGIELGAHRRALAVASELPSRLFKRSRFAAPGYDAHFLRWMLSDGAGAMLLGDASQPLAGAANGVRLRLKWIHQRSFSGDYPVCMQLGQSAGGQAHLDYGSWSEAEAAGALLLRQDILLLPHLFDIGIHEYAKLVHDGWVDPRQVSHFLCHYSSEKFIPVVEDLMDKAGLAIARERWFSNLAWRGNTGAASILIMLAEFLQTRTVQPGEQIFCYIPESGRFMAAYMLLQAEGPDETAQPARARAVPAAAPAGEADFIAPPHDPAHAPQGLEPLLGELAAIITKGSIFFRAWTLSVRLPAREALRIAWTRGAGAGWTHGPRHLAGSWELRRGALSKGAMPDHNTAQRRTPNAASRRQIHVRHRRRYRHGVRLHHRGRRLGRLRAGQSPVGRSIRACAVAGSRRRRFLALDPHPGRLPVLHRQPAHRLVLSHPGRSGSERAQPGLSARPRAGRQLPHQRHNLHARLAVKIQ